MNKNRNKIAFVMAICALVCTISFFGCKKEEKPKIEYNPALKESKFLNDLSKYQILMIAPASKAETEKLQALKTIPGLNLKVPETIFSDDIIFHANSDENRFAFLKEALETEEPNTIVWSFRGGYGVARLLDKLKTLPKPKTEKLVVGYSDLTALHLFLSQNWGWKTIQGAMLLDLLKPNKDPNNFLKLSDLLAKIQNKNTDITAEISHLVPLNESAKHLTTTEGLLTGGNLTMVETSLGTNWQIQSKNKILFFEDESEKGYKVDRSLMHLKQAGVFEGAKAIVFGDFTVGDEFNNLALQRFAQETEIPVFKTNEFGHGIKNYPIIYNANSTIQKSENGADYKLIMRW